MPETLIAKVHTEFVTCVIVDDELQVRNRLESLLLKLDNIKVLWKEGVAEHAVKKVHELKPDIVFIDVEMPRMNGFDLIKAIREGQYYPTFIFVTAYNQYAIKAIKSEAFDYLLKPVDIDELKCSLERYKQCRTKNNYESIMKIPLFACLSEREKEVLKYVIKGYTSKKIAELLFISKATVDTHRKKILEKTDANKLSDLIIKVLANI